MTGLPENRMTLRNDTFVRKGVELLSVLEEQKCLDVFYLSTAKHSWGVANFCQLLTLAQPQEWDLADSLVSFPTEGVDSLNTVRNLVASLRIL